MLEIRKGSQVLRVSKCAYNDTFKKLGYEVVDNSKEEAVKASSDDNQEAIDNQDEKFIDEEQEKNNATDENKDVVTSENLNVNIIGENINDFGNESEEETKIEEAKTEETEIEETKPAKSILEQALQNKENKPKRK